MAEPWIACALYVAVALSWFVSDRRLTPEASRWAGSRSAMNARSAGGMTWSPVSITAQGGMVFQAGGPNGSW